MTPLPHRSAMSALALALGSSLVGCADHGPDITGPTSQRRANAPPASEVRLAVRAQERHTDALLRTPGVVGTAVGRLPNGRTGIRVFVATPSTRGVPLEIDGIPVTTEVTGMLVALSDPTQKQRPAPLGFSVGHPAITAGTLGARVVDQAGNVYILSNNHVLANSNGAAIGDATLQPGSFDGGTAADQIGTLAAFRPIVFSGTASNTMDAAIALVNGNDVGFGTPEDGYGLPGPKLHGDANADGTFDNVSALLGLPVQKFGRTTHWTKGAITGINATLTICYEVLFIFCMKSARFVDQLIIEPGGFSGGGDSGSLIVTDDGTNSPVGLLFAGSSTQTIANRLDLVLQYFGVSIDVGAAPPPTPLMDVAVTGVSAPGSVTQGATANVVVSIRNVGNQAVESFDVSLQDATDAVALGTQTVAGLASGETASVPFAWNTSSSTPGLHTLRATHSLPDGNDANNQASTTTMVNSPSIGMHIGDLDGFPSRNSNSWSATVEIAVHDANHNPLNGVTVVGKWSRSGLNANTCTTGELGGNGTCIVLFPSISLGAAQIRFTVNSVTRTGFTYQSTANHDVDGSSNGTVIIVQRP